jgi:hypothetical protein
MSFADVSPQTYIGAVEDLGKRYTVFCRVAFDGVEYVGRLWFAEQGTPDVGVPDRAAMPGRTREEVLNFARRLTPDELGLRQRRAFSEKRQYMRLRRITDDILVKIRYLNQIAISVHGGLLDEEGARQEIELTERQLHECVDKLRHNAGITG